jgi:hypothetical protein
MTNRFVELRESLYLLSIELVILYCVAFGLLTLKTDNMFSVGMAYSAVLCTSLLAYILPTLALLFSVAGFETGHIAVIGGARGAAVFMTAAFLLLALLTVSLWSTPLVCVYVNDTSTQCYSDADSTWQDTDPADVRFVFPSRAQYFEYTDMANATVADIFLKTTLSENDYVTKLHAVLAVPLVFIILVLQNSFFYAIYSVESATDVKVDERHAVFTAVDLFRLFVRCALLLLCVVIDSTDFFPGWNIVDVGPQMLPSLVFMSALIFADFSDTLLENRLETWKPSEKRVRLKQNLGLLVSICTVLTSLIYTLLACLVTCHYIVGGFTQMGQFITDTRLTTINIVFMAFLLLDALSTFIHSIFKIYQYVPRRYKGDKTNMRTTGVSGTGTLPSIEKQPPFHSDANDSNLNFTPAKKEA